MASFMLEVPVKTSGPSASALASIIHCCQRKPCRRRVPKSEIFSVPTSSFSRRRRLIFSQA